MSGGLVPDDMTILTGELVQHAVTSLRLAGAAIEKAAVAMSSEGAAAHVGEMRASYQLVTEALQRFEAAHQAGGQELAKKFSEAGASEQSTKGGA
jgi:hypothetical protein